MEHHKFRRTRRPEKQAGQAMLFTVLALGVFLIGAMAFAIDMSNTWFNRQSAQTASDAACTAAAMDMLVGATNGSMPSTAHFTPGSAFDCNIASPTPSPCSYAALNGFNSSINQGAANSGTLGNNVYVDFPGASSVGLTNLNLPPSSVASSPLVRVQINNNIPTWFAGMLKGMTKLTVGASSICAVVQATSPIPILVLHPTLQDSFSVQGNPNISIVGGPSKSVQVNSCSSSSGASSPCQTSTAANVGGSATVNLCAGGGSYCGSSMGVWGSESVPGGFITSCAGNRPPGAPSCSSQQVPQWNSPSPPIADPLASLPAPDVPSITRSGPYTSVPGGSKGCPLPSTQQCDEYGPGYYPGGITVKNATAIFDPGIYYLLSQQCNNSGSKGSFCTGPNSCIRPSTDVGDGSGGTIFYFADTNSVNVGANAGCSGVLPFNTQSGTGSLANGVLCQPSDPVTGLPSIPANLPATLDGSVLLAPCHAPTAGSPLCASATTLNPGGNCSLNYGDPQGTSDPIGEQRGVLFFQNRSVNAGNNPGWSGGGNNLLAGTMYFHQCVTTSPDTGQGCVSGAFNDQMNLFGNSGASTYVLGDIIVDQLKLGGGGSIVMDLNPSTSSTTLKAALVK